MQKTPWSMRSMEECILSLGNSAYLSGGELYFVFRSDVALLFPVAVLA